jgi:predicted O-methyltransferase YrrM
MSTEADWEERFSNQYKRTYFYNLVTKQSVWEDPRPALRTAASSSSSAVPAAIPSPASNPTQATAASSTEVATSTTSSSTALHNKSDEQIAKRSRHEIATSADVVTTSYRPPVSGSAQDSKALPEKVLPRPRIIPTLPPAPPGTDMYTRPDIHVNACLRETYFNGYVVDRNNVRQQFKDITNPLQGRHIYNMIRENRFTHTLEVGLAMGASACWITQAHRDNNLNGHHIAIDPNQTTQYEGIGKYLVGKCGNSQYLEVMEMTSFRALPMLFERVRNGKIPKFDFIYIDGWHTFDYTLVDFFYADLLLNVHGIIHLDDIKHHPVKRCFDYLKANYPHYEVVEKTPVYDPKNPAIKSSQATFIKLADDTRTWNYHQDF